MFPNIKRIVEITKRGLTTVQFITQELFKMTVSNHWSEFDNFPQTTDEMLTEWRININFPIFHLYQNLVDNDFLLEMQKVIKLSNGNELQLPPILLGESGFLHHVWL